MGRKLYASLALAVLGLCSVETMAAMVGGGSTLPENLYRTPGVLGAGFDTYLSIGIGIGSGYGKLAVLNNDATKLGLAAGTTVDYAVSDSVLSLLS